MGRLLDWLAARPHRATVVNILMFSLLLAATGSSSLFALIGGLALGGAFLFFVTRAFRLTLATRATTNLYQVVLTWVPGLLATALALFGVHLGTTNAPTSLAYGLGAVLFAIELSMLALAGADLSAQPFDHPMIGAA